MEHGVPQAAAQRTSDVARWPVEGLQEGMCFGRGLDVCHIYVEGECVCCGGGWSCRWCASQV